MSSIIDRFLLVANNARNSLYDFSLIDSYNGFIANYIPEIPSAEEIIQRILKFFWIYIGLPLTKIIIISTLFSTFAGITAYTIRKMLIPNAVMNEIIYFDFSLQQPFASLNVLKLEKQWQYIENTNHLHHDIHSRSSQKLEQYFTSGSYYNIDIKLIVPLSKRNKELGKFMMHMTLFDNAGDAVAKSSRPIVLYTHSDICHYLYSLFTFPMRIIGLLPFSETVTLNIPFITEYQEPYQVNTRYPATESVDITINTALADIEEAYITIMPSMSTLM